VLLHRIVHHDTFRRYHELGYAVSLQLGLIFAVLLDGGRLYPGKFWLSSLSQARG
jgi:hypothetical protein